MREPPVQPDKMLDHQKFTNCASALIDRVFSTRKYYHPFPTGVRSIEELRRAEIVAQTRISWDPKELLALISEHLDSLGYANAAKTLYQEAELSSFYKMHKMKPIVLVPKPRAPPRLSVTVGQPGEPLEIVKLPSNESSLPSRVMSHTSSLIQPQRIMFPAAAAAASSNENVFSPSRPATGLAAKAPSSAFVATPPGSPMSWPSRFRPIANAGPCGDPPPPSTPETYVSVKRQIQLSRGLTPVAVSPLVSSQHPQINANTVAQCSQSGDLDLSNTVSLPSSFSNPALIGSEDKSLSLPWRASLPKNSRTLNNIVESYLESQHAKCERPIVFCPPFSLKE